MLLKIDTKKTGCIIAGLRIALDGGKSSPSKIHFRIFNRKITMKAPGAFWYDIPLCDAEIIYAVQFNNGVIDTEFYSDNAKECPI